MRHLSANALLNPPCSTADIFLRWEPFAGSHLVGGPVGELVKQWSTIMCDKAGSGARPHRVAISYAPSPGEGR